MKPSKWQAGMHWRKERYKSLLTKIGVNLGHGQHEYIDTGNALRTASKQFMIDIFSKSRLAKDFFNITNFNNLVSEFLQNNSVRYEKLCYPLSFLLWADIFLSEEKNGFQNSNNC